MAQVTALVLAGLVGGAAMLAPASEAEACGGTFCDAGPQQMPVDQTGENILFVVEDGWVEAHVQIQYMGDPAQFAWIVPMTAEPEITAGSDLLFQNMLQATVPTFVLNSRFEACEGGGGPMLCAADSARSDLAGGSATAGGDGGETGGGDPDVLSSGVAGAFEYAVLSGGTVDGITQWLDTNGYARDDDAPAILEEYLAEDFLFVAFKLVGGADVNEIHPVVLRYQGMEPCVPIRLTRIAAQDDMGIRVFFLGEHRAASTNYRNVLINPFLVDWVNLGSNYTDVVTRAVDVPGSDGRGFVTEYAGSSDVVPLDGLLSLSWDSSRFVDIDPILVVDELSAQGLVSCSSGSPCFYNHPLVQGLLERWLPRPTGVTADEFYACLSCYETEIDLDVWSGPEFAAAFEERIVAPGEHATDIVNAYPYLTRLFTTMSAHEMTEDPLFHQNPDLPEVSNIFNATRVNVCDGTDYIELEDGRRIAIDDSGMLPDDMPAAASIEEIPESGAPMVLAEFEAEIEGGRKAWNRSQGLDDGGSCNCRSTRRRFEGAVWMLLLLTLGWRARRLATRPSAG